MKLIKFNYYDNLNSLKCPSFGETIQGPYTGYHNNSNGEPTDSLRCFKRSATQPNSLKRWKWDTLNGVYFLPDHVYLLLKRKNLI